MKKISIIIPVYNGENYIKTCLSSIFNQTESNYEIIVIDDNSDDNSYNILKNYEDKIKLYKVCMHDPSSVRNYGLSKCSGDLILFLDMDDTLNENLIEEINKYNYKEYDMLRFQAIMVNDDKKVLEKFITDNIGEFKGIDFLNSCTLKNEIYSPSWLYCYNRRFWLKNNFKFLANKTQEDFGLTSFQLYKASKIISIPLIGYYYYNSNNSIMRNNDYCKTKIKSYDVLYHADSHYYNIVLNLEDKAIRMNIINYLLNVLTHKLDYLNDNDKIEYEKQISLRKNNWR